MFSKIIIKGQELWKKTVHLLFLEGQPTKAVLPQTFMGVFFIRSVSDTILAMLFLTQPPRTAV
jgi:hypothetical protein